MLGKGHSIAETHGETQGKTRSGPPPNRLGREHNIMNSVQMKNLQHTTVLLVEEARDTLVEPIVEPKEKPKVKPGMVSSEHAR